ncbi:MAG: glycosyltransferase [Lachnospiraceae bacterium]|nr:glycosyltransferase [Lachnospiraceae bacterium]
MHTISVIIPTYNRAGFIQNSVRSVLNSHNDGKDYELKEVIIVDDNSEDDTELKVKELIKESRCEITYHKLNDNKGPGNARNIGAEMAVGDLIAFQDSDDEWKPLKLQKQINLLNEHPEYDLIYTGFTNIFEDGKASDFIPDLSGDIFDKLCERNCIDAPTMLINKNIFLNAGGFDTDFPALEDWDLALRISFEHKIGCVSESLITSHILSDGVSSNAQNHFIARSMLIGKNKSLLMKRDMFNTATASLLNQAKDYGILKEVGALLEKFL